MPFDIDDFWESLGYDPITSPGFPPLNIDFSSFENIGAPMDEEEQAWWDYYYGVPYEEDYVDPFAEVPYQTGELFTPTDIVPVEPLPDFIDLETGLPVYAGTYDPNEVSYYDETGQGFLLPWDQDDPALASSFDTLMESLSNINSLTQTDVEGLMTKVMEDNAKKGITVTQKGATDLVSKAMNASGFSLGSGGGGGSAKTGDPNVAATKSTTGTPVTPATLSSAVSSSSSMMIPILGLGIIAALAFGRK